MRPVSVIAALLERAVLKMRMGTVVVAIRPGLVVRVAVLESAMLMMSRSHALRCHHRGHPLDRDGQGQQHHGKKAEENSSHRREL